MNLSLLWTISGAAFTLIPAYSLGRVILRKRPSPPEIVLGTGAAILSVCVFLLILVNLAHWGAFLALGAAVVAAGWRFGGSVAEDPIRVPRPVWIVFGAYGLWYLVNALAPETLADGITYHMGLPR